MNLNNELDKAYDEALSQLIDLARDDFYTFVRLMAPVILPEDFIDGRHLKLVCDALQEIEDGVADKKKKPGRLMLFMPPGSMKSKIASNLFPAWCFGRHPNWCFLAIGSDFEFAVDNFGRPTKDLVESARFQAIFPKTSLKSDVSAAGRWDTSQKGRFVARGAGQGIAGRRAHISICDDVITEQTTDAGRKDINKWYRKGLRSRLLPRGAEIIINTRWHLEDLSGFLLKVDAKSTIPWKVLSFPALLNREGSDLLRRKDDPKELYAVGTSYWPEFWPTELLQEKKATTPSHEWNALYMQSPTSEEGGIVKQTDFQIWKQYDDKGKPKPPKCRYVIISVDTAFSTKESADYSAYSVWGIFKQEVEAFNTVYSSSDMAIDQPKITLDCAILLAAGKGHWDFAELCTKCAELNSDYFPDFFIIENKASGQSLITEMRKRGLPVISYQPERDKMFRLQATTPYFQAKRIYVPQGYDWVRDLVDEVCTFPHAPNDDYTDTVSQAILWMRDTFYLDNDGYSNRNEEDEFYSPRKHLTYWSSLTK